MKFNKKTEQEIKQFCRRVCISEFLSLNKIYFKDKYFIQKHFCKTAAVCGFGKMRKYAK